MHAVPMPPAARAPPRSDLSLAQLERLFVVGLNYCNI
uniref:Uncharacterized protein n=1 Tax=Setaria italica TaxID=4555 RepID=K3ZPU7_SETIT